MEFKDKLKNVAVWRLEDEIEKCKNNRVSVDKVNDVPAYCDVDIVKSTLYFTSSLLQYPITVESKYFNDDKLYKVFITLVDFDIEPYEVCITDNFYQMKEDYKTIVSHFNELEIDLTTKNAMGYIKNYNKEMGYDEDYR